jgi:muramoyltetrapeptide carboxypeptidase
MTPRTRAGLVKFRPLRPGGGVALVAPASPFDRAEFDAGVAELRRLGYEPVIDPDVFDRAGFVAGAPAVRARALRRAMAAAGVDAVMSVRGGYGSVQLLPLLDAGALLGSRTALVGYSDVTSLHVYLGCVAGLASVHGPMLEGRLARGPEGYDVASFQTSLSAEPLGELAPEGLEAVRTGEAEGPLFGGTITQLLGSLATPYAFDPPAGHVLFLDEVGERPYRLHRMLVQLQQSGRLGAAAAVVFGQLPRCDEPGGAVTARGVVSDVFADFPGPVLVGFPSGHTTTPCLSLPLGVHARVVAAGSPRLVVLEAAAA